MAGSDRHNRDGESLLPLQKAPMAHWEKALAILAVCAALCLGTLNLAVPSLWHDELVHVFVARSIVETWRPCLPSGNICGSAPLYNAVLAGVIAVFGDGEGAVRMPSVLLAAATVMLTFLLVRSLLGRPTALVAAFALALSPWSVAWSRQARFYALQGTVYLVTLWLVWRLFASERVKAKLWLAIGAGVTYVCAILTSLHSVLFLATVGSYALFIGLYEKRGRYVWALVCCAVAVAAGLTMLGYYLFLPTADSLAIFKEAGIGTKLTDPVRGDRFYYVRWLWQNLSAGVFVLALVGFVLMLWHEGRRGLFVALAFWAPVLVLTFLIAYRRPRFMYFTFPFYVTAFSYGLVRLARFLPTARRSWLRAGLAVLIAVFLGRLALSAAYLTRDSMRVARGAHVTLARRHPQWREPCRYVRQRLHDGTAVLATTFIPVLYYVGRVDDWYPSRCIPWENWETGREGLKGVRDLEAFVAKHPKGYFLAEWWRFDVFPEIAEDRAWVQTHMRRIEEGSSVDVTLYAWGMDAEDAERE